MKSIGFIIPNYPNEKRVALFPDDAAELRFDKVYIEKGFGETCGIDDFEYEAAGCIVLKREDVFKNSDIIFSLKLIQPSDYSYLRRGQIILGWTHPFGSGANFFKTICQQKGLIVIDIDSTCPRILFKDKAKQIDEIDVGFCSENSYLAGTASVLHALLSFGSISCTKKVAVLSSGNVAQGAFNALSKIGFSPIMFYRKTLPSFYNSISDFDIIVNGIEVTDNSHIIKISDCDNIKKDCLIIDAAADAGGAIEFTTFTGHQNPINRYRHIYYYCVNNSPSIIYRDVSPLLSKIFTKYIYKINYDFIIEKYLGKTR